MKHRNKAVLTALILAVAACAGTDANKTGSDFTDLTSATYGVATSASIGATSSAYTIDVGETLQLSTTFVDSKGRKLVGSRATLVKWTSSSSTIATVSTTGLVKGVGNGVASITATYGKQTAVTAITVGTGNTAPVIPDEPAPTDTTPTAPAPPSSSTGPGLSGLALVSDDFTKYSSTADLMANITSYAGGTGDYRTAFYIGGVNANLAQIDKTVLYNGHQTLKYNQPGGTAKTPELKVYFPARSHIWYRVKVRFSPGYTTKGTLVNSSNAYKLIAWGWSGADGSGRIEITNTTEYQLYENVQSGPSLIGGGAYLHAGNITTEWSDGGWYDYVVEVDHSHSTGVIRLWRGKSGQALVYKGQAIEKMNNGSLMPAITNIAVGLNFNQVRAADQNQALWWGQWEVVDGTQHPNPFGLSY